MILSFELTMPSVNSWNGRWSGADKKYYVIRKTSKTWIHKQDHFGVLLAKGFDSFYYNFGDGWGANVRVEIITSSEAKKRRKVSAGFCGYEWMINTIMYDGYIHTGKETISA